MKKIFSTIVISAFFISLFIFISSFISNKISDDDYTGNNYLRYEDYIYVDHIKTVLLHHTGTPLSYPIIQLNGTEQLLLSFDDF